MSSVSIRDSRNATRATMRVVLLLSGVLTVVFLISFAFSEEGISELQRSRQTVSQLRAEIERLKKENERLTAEIESLQRSTYAVERIAREDLGMSKPGEIVYVEPAVGGGAVGDVVRDGAVGDVVRDGATGRRGDGAN